METTLRAQQDFASQVQSVTLIATQNLELATPDCNAMLDELTFSLRSATERLSMHS